MSAKDNELSYSFGRAIKRFRQTKRITQRSLAKRMGVSPIYMSLVETGKKSPSLDFLRSACQALEVPPEVMLFYAAVPTDVMKKEDRKVFELAKRIIEEYADRTT